MIDDILEFNKKFVESKGYEKYITNKYPDKKIPFPRISMCSGRSQSTAIAFPHKGSSINFVMFFKIIKESKVS